MPCVTNVILSDPGEMPPSHRQLVASIPEPHAPGWDDAGAGPLLEVWSARPPTAPIGIGPCDGALVRLELVGELCTFSAPQIERDLVDSVTTGMHLVLDLAGVTFCDAAGLRVLLTVRGHLERERIGMALEAISASVSQILVMAGVRHLFPLTVAPAAPAASEVAPGRFEITNRDGGQVIDLTVHGELSIENVDDVERRLLRLISLRQPARLNVDIRSSVPLAWESELVRAQAALAEVGGTLIVTSAADAGG